MSGGYDYWLDAQRDMQDSAPDIRVLWSKSPVARKVHRCARCGDEIAKGDRYESEGIVTDGVFAHEKRHRFANNYPSGCPSVRVRDLAEIEADRAADRDEPYPCRTTTLPNPSNEGGARG